MMSREETMDQNKKVVLEKINGVGKTTISDLAKLLGWTTGKVQKVLIHLLKEHQIYLQSIPDVDNHRFKVYYSTSPIADKPIELNGIVPSFFKSDTEFTQFTEHLFIYFQRIEESFSYIKGLSDEDGDDALHKDAKKAWKLILQSLTSIYKLPKTDIDDINAKMSDDFTNHSNALQLLIEYMQRKKEVTKP